MNLKESLEGRSAEFLLLLQCATAPGDMIATGSQAGVGVASAPPEFLHAEGLVEVSAEGI